MACTSAKFWVLAHKLPIHLVCVCWPLSLRSTGQATRSSQNQMCTPELTLSFKIVLWLHFYYDCFETFRMRYWSGYLQNTFSDLRSGQFLTRHIISHGEITVLPNMTNFNLTWSVICEIGQRSKYEIVLGENRISLDLSQREKHVGVKFVALGTIFRKVLQKNIRFQKCCVTPVNFDLYSA